MSNYIFEALKEQKRQEKIQDLSGKFQNIPLDFEKIIEVKQ